MNPEQAASQFYLGGAVGLVSAVVAMLLQMRIRRRNHPFREYGSPGCVLMVSGCLGGIGLFVAGASVLLTGGIRLAVTPGLGVLAGFFIGSSFMILLRLLPSARHAKRTMPKSVVE